MVFDYLSVKFDYGPGIGAKAVSDPAMVFGERRRRARRHVLSSPRWPARGRSTSAGTGTRPFWPNPISSPAASTGPIRHFSSRLSTNKEQPSYGGFDDSTLCMFRRVDGELLRALPPRRWATRLKVKPYRGDLGLFRIGPGSREIKEICFPARSARQLRRWPSARRRPAWGRKRRWGVYKSRWATICRRTFRWNMAR